MSIFKTKFWTSCHEQTVVIYAVFVANQEMQENDTLPSLTELNIHEKRNGILWHKITIYQSQSNFPIFGLVCSMSMQDFLEPGSEVQNIPLNWVRSPHPSLLKQKDLSTIKQAMPFSCGLSLKKFLTTYYVVIVGVISHESIPFIGTQRNNNCE